MCRGEGGNIPPTAEMLPPSPVEWCKPQLPPTAGPEEGGIVTCKNLEMAVSPLPIVKGGRGTELGERLNPPALRPPSEREKISWAPSWVCAAYLLPPLFALPRSGEKSFWVPSWVCAYTPHSPRLFALPRRGKKCRVPSWVMHLSPTAFRSYHGKNFFVVPSLVCSYPPGHQLLGGMYFPLTGPRDKSHPG